MMGECPDFFKVVRMAPLVALVWLLLIKSVQAFFTVDCGIVTVERSDPIVSPGQESSHFHVVAGSDGFSQSATNANLREGTINEFILWHMGDCGRVFSPCTHAKNFFCRYMYFVRREARYECILDSSTVRRSPNCQGTDGASPPTGGCDPTQSLLVCDILQVYHRNRRKI